MIRIKCSHCTSTFEDISIAPLKIGADYFYFKCPSCGKVFRYLKTKLEKGISGAIANPTDQKEMGDKSQLPEPRQAPKHNEQIRVASASNDEKMNDKMAYKSTDVPGWLVVHDELAPRQILDLKVGENIIGRKSSNLENAVLVKVMTNDLTVSRKHCRIEVILNKQQLKYEFLLNDLDSTNGVVVKGNSNWVLDAKDQIYLEDNDFFQMGLTKVTLKVNTGATIKKEAAEDVFNKPYPPTIKIMKPKI